MNTSPERNINFNAHGIKAKIAIAASALAIASSTSAEAQSTPSQEGIVAYPHLDLTHDKSETIHSIKPRPPIRLPVVLKRIGGCESNGSPTAKIDYRAQNRYTTASGGFQFLDSTWDNFRGYRRAMHAPPRVQKIKAKRTLRNHGTRPWAASQHCWAY